MQPSLGPWLPLSNAHIYGPIVTGHSCACQQILDAEQNAGAVCSTRATKHAHQISRTGNTIVFEIHYDVLILI